MKKQNEHFHGSDIEKIEHTYGIKKEEIISFSGNVNPLGISPLLRETLRNNIDAISEYPQREYTSLRKCIGRYLSIDFENIIVGNGSTELISLFIQFQHPKNACIIGPTYSEYEREITLLGGNCRYYPLKEELNFQLDMDQFMNEINQSVDLLVICNPNNPTSTSIGRQDMLTILKRTKELGIFVMIDETYVEFVKDYEHVTAASLCEQFDNLIVLRGTSKFFAAPGLRLGYGVTGNKALISMINNRKNPWTLNSLAAVAAEAMFLDYDYIERTKSLIFRERKRMYELLDQNPNYLVYEPTANFLLVQLLDPTLTSSILFQRAIRKKLMIRDCSSFPFLNDKFIRFCIMKPEMNDRLLDFLLNF